MSPVAMNPGAINSGATMRSRREQLLRLLAVAAMAATVGGRSEAAAQAGSGAAPADGCAGLRVIQGRITAIDGSVLTVKTPDSYPGGGPGIHAQFVMRGPEMRVDISQGRLLHPDGQQEDRQPLAVGERVVVVLQAAASGGQTANVPNAAMVVERVSTSDRVATH